MGRAGREIIGRIILLKNGREDRSCLPECYTWREMIKLWQSFKGLNPDEIINVFYSQLQEEIGLAKGFLNDERLIKEYMATLGRYRTGNERDHIPKYHFANRLRDAVSLILEKMDPVVLDVGSGLGTESLLFGLLGAKVLGVDIHPVRTEVAKKRGIWYRYNIYSDLKLEFAQRDIIQFLTETKDRKGDFFPNTLLLKETISHIFPPEDFLSLAYSVLQPNGKIIIMESNPLNFAMWIKNWKDRASRYKNMPKHEKKRFRRGNIYLYPWKFQDPNTRKEISICNEKLWRPWQLRDMLRTAGFFVEKVNIYRFVPDPLMIERLLGFWSNIEICIKKIPTISQLGVHQIIIASKQGK